VLKDMGDQPASKTADASTTVMLLWIFSGVILVSAVYLLVPSSDAWLPLNAAGATAALYLIVVVFFVARKPVGLLSRVVLIVLALSVIGLTAFTWITEQRSIEEQREYIKQRSEISSRGVIFYSVSQNLLQTLRTSRENNWTRTKTLEEIFRIRNVNVDVGKPLTSVGYYSSTKAFVETLKADSIVLIAVDPNSAGRDPGFINYKGGKGYIQERFTLTRKGLVYESQN
jgi:energy-coupling factor transporter transmembrane protein EcfT